MNVPGSRRTRRRGSAAGQGVDPSGGAIGVLDRRTFLVRSGAAAALLGLAASAPGSTALLSTIETDGPAVDTGAASAADVAVPTMTDPVVAHVTDVATGEISIYSGTQEVVLRNPALAAQLVRASR
jgi:hypothetical protein